MTVKSFTLGRSLINAIFFQTFLLDSKLFHKIIVLIMTFEKEEEI